MFPAQNDSFRPHVFRVILVSYQFHIYLLYVCQLNSDGVQYPAPVLCFSPLFILFPKIITDHNHQV